MTVIGPEAQEVYTTFEWENEGDEEKIKLVLDQFKAYCEPKKNIPFERYCFNQRQQQTGETYDQYKTALKKLAEGCDFAKITPDEILRDRLLFGIADNKVRERLLRETNLTLEKTDDLCHASERMAAQLKIVAEKQTPPAEAANAVSTGKRNVTRSKPQARRSQTKEIDCSYCGQRHAQKKELCPAYGKKCTTCGKNNHFANKCRTPSRPEKRSLHNVDYEVFTTTRTSHLKESELVTLRLESGNYMRFQPDTGAQCNVIPVELYKKATKDHNLERVEPIRTPLVAYVEPG